MSLDVYLTLEVPTRAKEGGSGIFIREGGSTREVTREEWDLVFPGREPYVAIAPDEIDNEVYSANITHNLNVMAKEAGIYDALWRPDENGMTHASQLIESLRAGLALLKSDPPRFEKLNPENGWGSYDGFVPWVEAYLAACEKYPQASVSVSR